MSLYLDQRKQLQNNNLCKLFQEALFLAKDSSIARNYLRNRNITKSIAKKFSIGWCPTNAKLSEDMEYFRGRIIFPIIDEYENTIAFSGRLTINKKEITGKQLRWFHQNYNKSFFLYGINVSYKDILKNDYVIITEGQTDVIACHKFGFTNTVGLMGSSFTDDSIAKITRFTRNFVLMYDGDEEGREAALKTKKRLLKHRNFKVIDIPLIYKENRYDPDEFLNKFGSKLIKRKMILLAKKNKENVKNARRI